MGIDLAWREGNRTGVAVVDESGKLTASGVVRSDDDIEEWIAKYSPRPRVVGVDAPLVVPNLTGCRTAEREIGRAYGRYRAGAYPSNRSVGWMNPPRGESLAESFGWDCDPTVRPESGRTACIEVYPHAALVGLFELPERVIYKKGPERQRGFLQLLDLLERLPELRLAQSARWLELRTLVASPRRGDLTRIEDEIDAILCAHLAWLWDHRPSELHVFGDFDEGYIVAPPPPAHPAAPRPLHRRLRSPAAQQTHDETGADRA